MLANWFARKNVDNMKIFYCLYCLPPLSGGQAGQIDCSLLGLNAVVVFSIKYLLLLHYDIYLMLNTTTLPLLPPSFDGRASRAIKPIAEAIKCCKETNYCPS